MPERIPPIARVRLARSIPRLVAVPLIVGLAGAAAIGAGYVEGGPVGIGLAVAGSLLLVLAIGGVVVPLSVRLEVEDAAIRVSWFGGERLYELAPGSVTRVALRGPNASRLRPSFGALGWALGAARLRDEEAIEVVRLARTRTAILVPTARGRLAIAAASESELLAALARAAHVRQRLEELARQAPPVEEAVADDGPAEAAPAPMTGIERALLEERMAQEGWTADVIAATSAAEAAAAPAWTISPPERHGEAAAAASVIPTPAEAGAKPAPAGATALPEEPPVPRAGGRRFLPDPGTALLVVAPLATVGVVWGLAAVLGRLPASATDEGRLVWLGLVLAGPATSIGVIVARAWWPRLMGVVVSVGMASLLLMVRGFIGG